MHIESSTHVTVNRYQLIGSQVDPNELDIVFGDLSVLTIELCPLSQAWLLQHAPSVLSAISKHASIAVQGKNLIACNFGPGGGVFGKVDIGWHRVVSSDLAGSVFTGVQFNSTVFKRSDLRGVRFNQCTFANCTFEGCYLNDIVFNRCIISQISMVTSFNGRIDMAGCSIWGRQSLPPHTHIHNSDFHIYDRTEAFSHVTLNEVNIFSNDFINFQHSTLVNCHITAGGLSLSGCTVNRVRVTFRALPINGTLSITEDCQITDSTQDIPGGPIPLAVSPPEPAPVEAVQVEATKPEPESDLKQMNTDLTLDF